MLFEIGKSFLFASNAVAVIVAVVYCLEINSYSKLMNTRQKVVNVLTIPAMCLFCVAWPHNIYIAWLVLSGLAWVGCIIDIFHLRKEEKGWRLTNLVEFLLLSFLLFGSIIMLLPVV